MNTEYQQTDPKASAFKYKVSVFILIASSIIGGKSPIDMSFDVKFNFNNNTIGNAVSMVTEAPSTITKEDVHE